MQPNWDDLKTVLALVRGQTLSAAAAHLQVSYTTISRRISRLEAGLNLVLFERLADGYRPTEAALLIAQHAQAMEAEQDAVLHLLSGCDDRLQGALAVAAPQLLIAHVLAPSLQRFRAAHPDVALTVRATNDVLDLSRREADLAVRISDSPATV